MIATRDSINTDGIRAYRTFKKLRSTSPNQILEMVMHDCISISHGSNQISITKQVNCGPGHGITVGKFQNEEPVHENNFSLDQRLRLVR